jgi:hypothetical protein
MDERSLRAAERVHDDCANSSLESFRATIQFAIEAIRTAALVNGGAVVGILTFTAATIEKQPVMASDLLSGPLDFFVSGVIFAGLGAGFSYFAQYCFTYSDEHVARTWVYPFLDRGSAKHKRWVRLGILFQVAAIVFVLGSFGALAVGVYASRNVVATSSIPP